MKFDNPYDDDVRSFSQEFGLSLDDARDRFIWVALQSGDTGPLICFLIEGPKPPLSPCNCGNDRRRQPGNSIP